MDTKDLFALILTAVAIIFFSSASSATKKKRANVAKNNPVPVPISQNKMGKKSSPKKIDRCSQVAPVMHRDSKAHQRGKGKLFSEKDSLKKGFIMQEVLKRPYE